MALLRCLNGTKATGKQDQTHIDHSIDAQGSIRHARPAARHEGIGVVEDTHVGNLTRMRLKRPHNTTHGTRIHNLNLKQCSSKYQSIRDRFALVYSKL